MLEVTSCSAILGHYRLFWAGFVQRVFGPGARFRGSKILHGPERGAWVPGSDWAPGVSVPDWVLGPVGGSGFSFFACGVFVGRIIVAGLNLALHSTMSVAISG